MSSRCFVEQVPRHSLSTPSADRSEGRPYGMALIANTTSRSVGSLIPTLSVNAAHSSTPASVPPMAPHRLDRTYERRDCARSVLVRCGRTGSLRRAEQGVDAFLPGGRRLSGVRLRG